ncbi:MAG TPA: M13 family metallopeptidase [Gemmatimonadaceae bacterium]|nr:M13 family metallopeptidase [Gemmatimonadaceae bacterium]
MTLLPTIRRLSTGVGAMAVLTTPLAAQPATTAAAAPVAPGIESANFDTSVRPQDDFFRYVNGSWLKSTEIPADKPRYGAFDQLRDESDAALRGIIEQAAAATDAPAGSDLQKIGDYYRAYMDTTRLEQLGLTPLRDELARVRALDGQAGIPALAAHLARIGVRAPYGVYVRQDLKDATRYVAYVGQSGLGLPDRDYYLKDGQKFDDARAAYVTYMTALLRAAGDAQAEASARAVLQLEHALAERQWERVRLRDPQAGYNPHTLAQLDTLAPRLAWSSYLTATGTAESPTFIVGQPDYLRALDAIVAATPVETWRSYFTVRLLDAFAPYLNRSLADAAFAFHGKALTGVEQQRPRWQRGVNAVEGAMGMLVGKQYVAKYFPPAYKAHMERLVDNLLAAYKAGIDQLDWMSPATKAQAQDKLAHFTVKIGYPDKWRDYSGLEVKPGDLVGNVIRSNQFDWEYMVDKLGEPVDRTEWGMTPQTVNAYYNPVMNEIVFPAAILQPPFFDPEADDAVNYGGIVAVIGHEVSHGFDDQGSQFDGEGNLRDWFTAADKQAFKARTEALAAQYDALAPLEGAHVNGHLTLGENIGDLSGLSMAYKAYHMSLGGREAPVIGGLTGDQRFFIGWAQVWRELNRDDYLRQRLLTDPHSPAMYRTNQVLRNMPAFAEAWGVKPGDGMYLPPAERVKIW